MFVIRFVLKEDRREGRISWRADATFKKMLTCVCFVQVCVLACVSSPGGVYASMEVCTTSERLLEGIGTATFLSTCRANTACTASVWTSEREAESHSHSGGRGRNVPGSEFPGSKNVFNRNKEIGFLKNF